MRTWSLLLLSIGTSVGQTRAFVVGPPQIPRPSADAATVAQRPLAAVKSNNNSWKKHHRLLARDGDDDGDLLDDREYARVRRGGGSGPGRERFDNPDDDYNYEEQQQQRRKTDAYYDDKEYVDDDDDDDDEEWDFIDELEEKWEDEWEEMEKHDLLGNVLIPNPILDNIDPDGAADRFPELARDPRFWFDMVLFLAFLDFLSFVGPRDPFPDLPLPYGPM